MKSQAYASFISFIHILKGFLRDFTYYRGECICYNNTLLLSLVPVLSSVPSHDTIVVSPSITNLRYSRAARDLDRARLVSFAGMSMYWLSYWKSTSPCKCSNGIHVYQRKGRIVDIVGLKLSILSLNKSVELYQLPRFD